MQQKYCGTDISQEFERAPLDCQRIFSASKRSFRRSRIFSGEIGGKIGFNEKPFRPVGDPAMTVWPGKGQKENGFFGAFQGESEWSLEI